MVLPSPDLDADFRSVVLPTADPSAQYRLVLDAQSAGALSLRISEADSSGEDITTFGNIQVGPNTVAELLVENSRTSALRIDGDGDGVFETQGSPDRLPVPASRDFLPYAPTMTGIASANLMETKPIGVGTCAFGGEEVRLQIAVGPLSAPVDAYLAIFAPSLDPVNVFLLGSDLSVHLLSEGLNPWKANTLGEVQEALYGDIPLSAFPPGTYYLGLLMTLVGNLDRYYLWVTFFESPEPDAPVSYTSSGQVTDQGANFAGGTSCCGCELRHYGTLPGDFPEMEVASATFFLTMSRENSFYLNPQEGPTALKLVLAGREVETTSAEVSAGASPAVDVPWTITFEFDPPVPVGPGTPWDLLDGDDDIYSAVGLHAGDDGGGGLPGVSETSACQYARTTDLRYSAEFMGPP